MLELVVARLRGPHRPAPFRKARLDKCRCRPAHPDRPKNDRPEYMELECRLDAATHADLSTLLRLYAETDRRRSIHNLHDRTSMLECLWRSPTELSTTHSQAGH